jgi:predicted Zn-dependent protease
LAECRLGLGDKEGAERLVDEVLAQQPQFPSAISMRGRLLSADGHYAEAETWLRQAVALKPSDHEARYALILCLFNTGRAEEAAREERDFKQLEEDIKRFAEIVAGEMPKRPDDPELHCTLDQLLLRSGHREEGLRWLNSALRLDPNYAPARQTLAEYFEKEKKRASTKP